MFFYIKINLIQFILIFYHLISHGLINNFRNVSIKQNKNKSITFIKSFPNFHPHTIHSNPFISISSNSLSQPNKA